MSMDRAKRIIKNTFSLSAVRVSSPLVSFLLVMLIARNRGVDFMGNYSVILAVFNIFVMISSLGSEILIMRDVSKNKEEAGKYVGSCFAILFLSGVFFAGVMSLAANISGYETDVRIGMYVMSLALIPGSLSVVCTGIIKAFERNAYILLASFVESLVGVGISIAALQMGFGLASLMTVALGAGVLGLFLRVSLIKTKVMAGIELEISVKLCKRILRSALTFGMIGIVVSLYWRIGIIILSKIEGPWAVGIFSAGFKLFALVQGFITAFGMSVFPSISRRFEVSSGEFASISVKAAKYILMSVLFLAVVITFLAGRIISLLYGVKFGEAGVVLQVLIWATVPYSMVTVFAYSLFSSYNQKVDLAINCLGLVAVVALSIVLVPRFSYLGTSLAVVISTCLLLICQCVFINRKLFRIELRKILALPALSSVIVILFVMSLRSTVNLYLLLACSGFVYFSCLYFLGGFDEGEKEFIKRVTSDFVQTCRLVLLR
jgi:O-antigen/teichoic acid export membrane protein